MPDTTAKQNKYLLILKGEVPTIITAFKAEVDKKNCRIVHVDGAQIAFGVPISSMIKLPKALGDVDFTLEGAQEAITEAENKAK